MRLRLPLLALALSMCPSPAGGGMVTPFQRLNAELRHNVREGNAQEFLRYCDLLGDDCAQSKSHLGDTLLHVAAEFGRYSIAKCEHLPRAVQPTCARSQRIALHRSRLTD